MNNEIFLWLKVARNAADECSSSTLARQYCLDPTNYFFNVACEVAGVDPEVARQAIRQRISQGKVMPCPCGDRRL